MKVTVIFSQHDYPIHTWETTLSNTSANDLAEAICATGLVEEEHPVYFKIVIDDTEQIVSNGRIYPSAFDA